MATYLAITTINPNSGWKVLAYGQNASKVEDKARMLIGDPAGLTPGSIRDIYTETEHKNMRVVSKSEAKKFGIDYDNSESFVTNFSDAILVQ